MSGAKVSYNSNVLLQIHLALEIGHGARTECSERGAGGSSSSCRVSWFSLWTRCSVFPSRNKEGKRVLTIETKRKLNEEIRGEKNNSLGRF